MLCAAGHYYNSISKLNNSVKYLGIDGNKVYIDFAKKFTGKKQILSA